MKIIDQNGYQDTNKADKNTDPSGKTVEALFFRAELFRSSKVSGT